MSVELEEPVDDEPRNFGDLCMVCHETLVAEGSDMCPDCLAEVFPETEAA